MVKYGNRETRYFGSSKGSFRRSSRSSLKSSETRLSVIRLMNDLSLRKYIKKSFKKCTFVVKMLIKNLAFPAPVCVKLFRLKIISHQPLIHL